MRKVGDESLEKGSELRESQTTHTTDSQTGAHAQPNEAKPASERCLPALARLARLPASEISEWVGPVSGFVAGSGRQ